MKVFAVTTNGGQIENDQTPQAVDVPTFLIPFVKESFKKYGFFADEFANYYPTINRAKHAITWALSN